MPGFWLSHRARRTQDGTPAALLLDVRPLQFLLKKLGYVKLTELPAPDQVLPPYSFMFRSDQVPPAPPCICAQGSTELPLPRRVRMGSEHEPGQAGPFPYPLSMGPPPVPPRAPVASRGLDYSDGDTQIMEAPSVQAMPSFMGLKLGQ